MFHVETEVLRHSVLASCYIRVLIIAMNCPFCAVYAVFYCFFAIVRIIFIFLSLVAVTTSHHTLLCATQTYLTQSSTTLVATVYICVYISGFESRVYVVNLHCTFE
uniref:Uncharacterized protein n=1 Tax=Trypanosoma vivax (strain Y486) TaxID=1055687 RepID=G0UA67_TRYVY|nr:hypothetical protein TVY486_1101840 [Trypanosoma vivax Y486]